MKRPVPRQAGTAIPGDAVYVEITRLAQRLSSDMLARMIDSAESYRGWDLSYWDRTCLIKLIHEKRHAICLAFTAQLQAHFDDFKRGSKEQEARDWRKRGSDGVVENEYLQGVVKRYQEAFKEFDRNILKRLQACLRRSRASVYENPLQLKRLCETFQVAMDDLNLQLNHRLALCALFSDRFIETLGPLYRRVDGVLLSRGMLPDVPLGRIHLRAVKGLSQSCEPKRLSPNQSICLLILLQQFKEQTRQSFSQHQNLFPELKKRLARSGFNHFDEQIEQLSMIFKLIFEDEDLPTPVKQQLARLQIYVFITAIQEDGFLRRSSNPARRLLEGIISSEVEIARKGKLEYSGIRFIREHIDGLARRKFITLDSYTEMLESYLSFLRDNEKAIHKSRNSESSQKIIPIVKSQLDELIQPLRKQGVSTLLFDKVWLPLLVQIVQYHGSSSDAWHKTIDMVNKQVWAMIPKTTKSEHAELMKILPQIEYSLHRAMRSLRLAETLQQSLREFFKLEQQNVIDKTTENIKKAQPRKTLKPKFASAYEQSKDLTEFDMMMQTGVFMVTDNTITQLDETQPPAPAPQKAKMSAQLTRGEWVNVIQGGVHILAKLAWKSDDNSLFIFVDRDGKRICEIDAETLERRFDNGDMSLMDSPISTVDSEKYRSSFMKLLR